MLFGDGRALSSFTASVILAALVIVVAVGVVRRTGVWLLPILVLPLSLVECCFQMTL